MKTKRVIGILLLIAVLSSCVTLGPPFKPVDSIPPGKALIYMYRTNAFVGGAISYDMNVNDKIITILYRGGYYPHFVDPGKIDIWARTESKSSVTFVAEEGKTYYVRGSVTMGLMVGRPKLEVIDEATGAEEIKKCGLLKEFTEEDMKKRKEEEDKF